jgi:hypothetical protein
MLRVQPRPAKSGETPSDDSFLIATRPFHAALAVTGITDGAALGFKPIREELRTSRRASFLRTPGVRSTWRP